MDFKNNIMFKNEFANHSKKILTIFSAIIIFSGIATAQSGNPFSGGAGDSNSISVELSEGWNALGLPINGEISTEELTDDCDLYSWSGGVAAAYSGEGYFTDTINGNRGYAVFNQGSSCTAEIPSDAVENSPEMKLPSGEWVVFSPYEDMVPSERTSCEFGEIDGSAIWEISVGGGNNGLSPSDGLDARSIYWVKLQGDDCNLGASSGPGDDPFGDAPGSGDDDSSDSDDDSGNDDSSDSGDSDSSYDDNPLTDSGYEFHIDPHPKEWPEGSNVEVRPELTVEGDNLEGNRVRLEINGVPGFNNDPQIYKECGSDGSCTADMSEFYPDSGADSFDSDDYHSFSVDGYVKTYNDRPSYRGGPSWESIAEVSWNMGDYYDRDRNCDRYYVNC